MRFREIDTQKLKTDHSNAKKYLNVTNGCYKEIAERMRTFSKQMETKYLRCLDLEII